jgi:succinate-semialdehyde dehydrogenase / glutarate-semialdehyde dehydrogenase
MNHYPEVKMLIDGDWRMSDPRPVLNPFDETEIGVHAHATNTDLEEAVAAAKRGMRVWGDLGPVGREAVMTRAANLLRERADEIARTITLEQGKTLREARAEVLRAAANIEWDGHEGRRLYGRIVPSTAAYHNAVYHQPVGIVAGFSPWNFPIASPSRKIGGALAAGCSVILKAAEDTPAGAFELVRAFVDAGIPNGVLNLVYGDPPTVSNYLIAHPDVRMVTFTGSVPVGKHLAALAGEQMKPVLMELGGHSPVFVSATADIDAAADASLAAKAINAGQVCVSPTRFFIEDAVYDRFVSRFVERAKALKLGNGLDDSTDMGPLINSRRINAVEALIADAEATGAHILSGGERIGNRGFAFPLTVLGNVPDTARAMREEPFGPLALLSRVGGIEEAVEKANSLRFGLAGYAFTRSARDIKILSQHLEVGILAINHFSSSEPDLPFGGIKDSGIGREGGIEGPLAHTVAKTVMTLLV